MKSLLFKISLGLLLLSCGCGGAGKMVKGPEPVPVVISSSIQSESRVKHANPKKAVTQSSLPVYASVGESDEWQAVWEPRIPEPVQVAIKEADQEQKKSTEGEKRIVRRTRGYRVQIFNGTNEELAKILEERAKGMFEHVYFAFQSPNYRVRAGDFARRSEADAAAREAKANGIRGAWVVPDRINIWE